MPEMDHGTCVLNPITQPQTAKEKVATAGAEDEFGDFDDDFQGAEEQVCVGCVKSRYVLVV